MRLRCLKILLAAAGLLAVGESSAVMLYRSATRNTSVPSGTFSNSGWEYQMQLGSFLGTPVGPHTFVTAAHIAPGTGFSFNWNSTNYTVTGGTIITGTDLAIRTVNNTFAKFAPVYNPTTDGSLIGKTLMIIGRGTTRGAEVNLATVPRAGESTLRGWEWGTQDGVQSWGTNVLDGFAADDSGDPDEYAYYSFDRFGTSEEATLSGGDSGGGTFAQADDGVWKLVGVNSGVDASFRLTSTGTDVTAAIFDQGNLYQYQGATNPVAFYPDEAFDLPTDAYPTNVTHYLEVLDRYIPKPGDATLDGKVNTQDFNLFAGHFGTSSFSWADGDFNHDGTVNSIDFTLMMTNYGFVGTPPLAPTAGVVVPEPATVGAVLLLSGLLLRRMRN